METYQAIIPAPFGSLGIRTVHGQLAGIDFLPHRPTIAPPDTGTAHICERLQAYFENPAVPLDMPLMLTGTEFQQRVWAALRRIPLGGTMTYGQLAHHLDSGARAVANACGANPIPLVIPCHRVVAARGLGGFMQGRLADALAIKRWLLTHEAG